MPYEESHVDGSVERIKEQVHVHVMAQLAAQNPAAERGVGLAAARPEEAFAEGGNEISVALPCAKDGRNYAAALAAKNLDELSHLLAHVRANGAGIREVEFPGRTGGERVCDKCGLVGPPPVNRCLANVGMGRHIFNGQLEKAILSQKFQRAVEDGQAGLFTARTAGEALAAAFVATPVSRRLLAHDLYPNI